MKAFEEYMSNFNKESRMILRKYNHSYRVSNISKMLAENLGLDKKDVKLATLIGLLHDIGRFMQAKIYNTFNDIDSVDHGDLGARILFEDGLISKFTKQKENYDVIKKCVEGHNKYFVNKEYDEKTLLHLKIIRDADKLDILNIFANLNEYDISFEGKISEKVKEQFFNNKLIENNTKKTKADWVVGTLSFVFDINFNESLEHIKQENFIKKIFERIDKSEDKEKLKAFFEYVELYIEKRLKEY